ncbi:SNF2 family N-terminal domain-containing protein [Truncatella angustata]|uniref:SNF2 family N-terminal domain-containing protein n=1 Tax=Truncatella angustata TaxID=152316 RepID=A0A9P8RPZ7_9PEZI|nr:SNF2 family N-terminal domain-containing protein [Truncatella angustata]KAH6647230.1 SNF2 family N-terminal domain-containing protein [Truncatella angustata]
MALSVKRLLNHESSEGDGTRLRFSNGHDSILNRSEEQTGGPFTEWFDHIDLGGEGVENPAFNADFQQWADDTMPRGRYSSSSADDVENVDRGDSQDERGDAGTAHGTRPGDICYGMLHNVDVKVVGDMSVLDAKLRPTQNTTLNQRFQLKDKTDHVQLSFADGTEFGYLRGNYTKGLASYLASPTLYFEAIVGTDTLRETIGRAAKPSEALVRVNINVYGPPSEADDVGARLSEHKLWLQKPDHLFRDIEYKNPQVLEFEDLDLSLLDQPMELLERGRAKPRTEEDHLLQTVHQVYNSTRRQDGLAQRDVSGHFKTKMLPHQTKALNFMIQRETGEIDEEFRLWRMVVVEGVTSYSHAITKSKSRVRPDEKGGGILADEMGMGKSLCILSLIVETLKNGEEWAVARRSPDEISQVKGHTRATLIVVSSALLINNWCKEIEEHLEDSLKIIRYHGPSRPKDKTGLEALENSDIVITTYNTLAKEFSTTAINRTSLLHEIEWYRVVLDEAHIIRRQATTFHRTCAELKARSRWCLTGTPIQNKLEDIGALFCFIKAKPFDSMAVFRRYIVVPFEQNEDRTAIDRLVQLNDSLCLRRTKELLDLPPLNESVRRLALNEGERKQYNNTKEILFRKIRQKAGEHEQTSKFGIFQANLQLRILCNHGTFQQTFSWQSERSLRDIKEAMLSAIGGSAQVNCDGCAQPMPVLGSNKVYNNFAEKCNHVLCLECLDQTAAAKGSGSGRQHCPLCLVFNKEAVDIEMTDDSQGSRGDDGELDDAHYFRVGGHSTKMNALISDVEEDLNKTKSIIFSCWTRTLNLVAKHLERANIPFSRIDGECPLSKRQKILDDFEKKSGNPVLIMTTGTGAFGLNLTCANRVFIVELQWNPSVESQAIARAIRLGQDRHVSVIRYIMIDTVEQDMQSQQQRKLRMAQKGFEGVMDVEE